MAMQEAAGFRVVALSPYREEGGISRDQLARRFEHITDTDIEISGAHIISTVDV